MCMNSKQSNLSRFFTDVEYDVRSALGVFTDFYTGTAFRKVAFQITIHSEPVSRELARVSFFLHFTSLRTNFVAPLFFSWSLSTAMTFTRTRLFALYRWTSAETGRQTLWRTLATNSCGMNTRTMPSFRRALRQAKVRQLSYRCVVFYVVLFKQMQRISLALIL